MTVARDLHSHGAIALEQDARGHRAGDDIEIGALPRRVQVGVRAGAAKPIALGELEAPHALLPRAVEVRVVLVAGLPRGLDHRVHERVHRAALGHAERSAHAVEGVLAALVVLGAPEVRQHVVVAPAVEPHRGPLVVVGAVAADVDHRVDRARPADHAAARQVEPAVAEAWLLLAEQIPVETRLEHRGERGRRADLVRTVRAARLEQRDAHVGVLAQPSREHAAGRAGAHDHVVVHRTVRHHESPPSSPRRDCSSQSRSPRARAPARTRG